MKKGSAQDVILMAILIFAFGVALLVLNHMGNQVTDKMLLIPVINESEATVSALEAGRDKGLNTLDWWVMGIFLAVVLSLITSSWFVPGNPMFILIYFIVVIIGVLLAMVLSNTWETISQTTVLSSSLAVFPITNHLLLYLPYYIVAVGLIGIVVMFGKPSGQGGNL